jgi:hypothetical protein
MEQIFPLTPRSRNSSPLSTFVNIIALGFAFSSSPSTEEFGLLERRHNGNEIFALFHPNYSGFSTRLGLLEKTISQKVAVFSPHPRGNPQR